MSNPSESENKREVEKSAEWLMEMKRYISEIKADTLDWDNTAWDGHLYTEGDTDKTDSDMVALAEFLKTEIGWDPERAEEKVEARYIMPLGESTPIKITIHSTDLGEGWCKAKWEHPDGAVSWDIQREDYFDVLLEAEQIEPVEGGV